MRKSIVLLFFAALLIVLPMYARSIFEARASLRAGEQELAAKNWEHGLSHLRRSLAWSSPFNSYSELAGVILARVAFDIKEPVDVRLMALRELLRGLRSSRGFLYPRGIDGSDEYIAQIRTEIQRLAGSDSSNPKLQLQESAEPRYAYQIAATILFWSWIGAVFLTIFRGFHADGSIKRRELAQGVGLSLVLYALWLCSLAQA